jgi:outer membrane protein insertion porin family
MPISTPDKTRFFQHLKNIFFLSLILSSCYVPKHYQKDKPFITDYSIEVKGGKFTKDETIALKSRLSDQLDDSAKVNVVDKYFIRHVYNNPPAFDTAYAGQSARNMKASMLHLGYYKADAKYKADTIIKHGQKRVTVQYIVEPGKPTLIDTVGYQLGNAGLAELTKKNMGGSLLEQRKPVTKSNVLGEISRLVQLYRNNGYYKFTAEELKVRGDTTLEALTNISDDPFEQLQLLAEAQQKKDSPEIKLAVVLNEPKDSGRLKKYYINNVYILPDYRPGDRLSGDSSITERVVTRTSKYIIRYHNKLFRTGFLIRNVTLKKGDLYNQENFYKMLNNFSRGGVWQSVNIDVNEVKDSTNKIDLVIQLIPAKQFSFEASVEASYSATSNTNSVTAANAGNLIGLSGNVSLTNRNLAKEGIKMTNAIRTGIELNLKPDSSSTRNAINSNELSLTNSIIIPRFILPRFMLQRKRDSTRLKFLLPETFSTVNVSYINRINLFNLQSSTLGIGYRWYAENSTHKIVQWVIKPLNIEFARLYNETDSFKKTLELNPFLRYSFNTSLVAGGSIGYNAINTNKKISGRQHTLKVNLEQSGFPLFVVPLRPLNILTNYLRQYLKTDLEYTHSRRKLKSALEFRLFAGVGIASKKDTALPFFKQYFGGGSNSMRGWPIRGIGRGSQPLAAYGNNKFNDRTGDIQLEGNFEFRHDLLQIIPNSVILKGAFFVDAGNIWNLRNSKPGGGTDSAQFNFKNLWKELGVSAGYGFRFDFNYFLVRFDFGFRFKRPELSYVNDGWKIPALSFNDVLQKVFTKGKNEEFRKWRYENFNFTIGINYPF